MSFTEICLAIMSAVSVFLLCANILLIFRHLSAKKALENQKNSIKHLLAVTAHDMRSPLTGIKGFTDAMLDGAVTPDKAEEYLAVISTESDRLARLASRLCEGDGFLPKKQIFSVSECVHKAFLTVERKAAAKNIDVSFDFSLDDEIYAVSDSDAVYEIVLNLFENAVKYCNNDGFIVWSLAHDDKFVTISVKNSTDIPLPSNLFAKGETAGKASDGSFGLGLFISANLAEKMGSKIIFESEKADKITVCSFTIYLEAAEEL